VWDKAKAIEHLNRHAQPHSRGYCAQFAREAIQAGGIALRHHNSAKDYGSSLLAVGFCQIVSGHTDTPYYHHAGDIAIIQPIGGHPHGHMAMFNGRHWVSDFIQFHGVYPGASYRKATPHYDIYRYPYS
jgi:hypothetical protein